jgi:branched-chain amino acid aminotransferase
VFALSGADAARGVATHSSGNHAAALARAAQRRGVPAYVVMPRNAPTVKRAAVVGYGGQVIDCEPTLAAREKYRIDQVLFCPNGEVQETGAANFLLIRDGHILTRSLDTTFLHGVTRDSLLTMARDMGWKVEERVFGVPEMLEWVKTGEAALSGTAAVLAGVGTLVTRQGEHRVGTGEIGPMTQKLRASLVAIQTGEAPDTRGWLEKV